MKTSDYQNLHYVGSFSTLQTEGNSQYMKHGAISFTDKQRELYGRLLKGLKYYPKEELYAMNSNKKTRIKKSHKRAQELLNTYKQEILIIASNEVFKKCGFTNLVSEMNNEIDPTFKCTLSFKELGLNKEMIAEKFIEAKLLPADFMVL